MKCSKYRQNMVLYFYDELSPEDRSALEVHLQACQACAQEFHDGRKTFDLLEKIQTESVPEAEWVKSWNRISQSIRTERRPKPIWRVPTWPYAAAAVVVVFALGILIGRRWPLLTETRASNASMASESIRLTLSRHFEDIKPVLIDFANSTPEEANEVVTVDKEFIRQLLIQNILLKRLLAEQDPSSVPLLEDTEIVLREIANLNREDTHAPSSIKEMIEQRDILYKIQIFKTI